MNLSRLFNCAQSGLHRVHTRMGDLWWYTIMFFFAQRFSDAVNLVAGLWLVPKYVPQHELGAVLPISQFASLVGIPLAIVSVPFMKFLALYASRGEMGKVKAMLRDVFAGTIVMALVTVLIAWLALPFVFKQMRIEIGSLGILIVAVAVVSYSSSVFQSAVQGLKLFSCTVWVALLSGPIRFLLMIAAMPFRPLSGYFVGQGGAPAFCVLSSLWVLRKKLGRDVKAENYWREDAGAIWAYTWPVALMTIFFTCFSFVDQFVIRYRLSDFESAGYYIISRFSDTAVYLSSAFVAYLFPMVAVGAADESESRKMLRHAVAGSVIGGALVSFVLFFAGPFLMRCIPYGDAYRSLSLEICLLATANTLGYVGTCLSTYEMARGRFRFLLYAIPLMSIKAGLLTTVGPANLRGIVMMFIVFNLVYLLCLACDVVADGKKKYNVKPWENFK